MLQIEFGRRHRGPRLAPEVAVPSADRKDRRAISRIAAHASWAATANPAARTAPARDAAMERFERQVDPEGTLSAEERSRRARSARSAYFAHLARLSARARRRRTN